MESTHYACNLYTWFLLPFCTESETAVFPLQLLFINFIHSSILIIVIPPVFPWLTIYNFLEIHRLFLLFGLHHML